MNRYYWNGRYMPFARDECPFCNQPYTKEIRVFTSSHPIAFCTKCNCHAGLCLDCDYAYLIPNIPVEDSFLCPSCGTNDGTRNTALTVPGPDSVKY